MDELLTFELPDGPVRLVRLPDGRLVLSTGHAGLILEPEQVERLHAATAPGTVA